MSDGPARGAANLSQSFLPVMAVNLIDHPVNIIIQLRAQAGNFLIMGQQFCFIPAKGGKRIYAKSGIAEPVQKAFMGITNRI